MMKVIAPMSVHITPHHLTLSPALITKVNEKIGSLAKFGEEISKANVVLRRHRGMSNGKRFSASARLSLPGRDIHARATHSNLYTAITALESCLARCLRKRKTRLEDRIVFARFEGETSAARLEESAKELIAS